MFSEADRLVYRWNDGTQERVSDPLALRRALVVAAGGDLAKAARDAVHPPLPEGTELEPERRLALEAAEERLAGIVAEGFGVKRFDPEAASGLTEAMLMRLWAHWCGWMEKNAGPPPS